VTRENGREFGDPTGPGIQVVSGDTVDHQSSAAQR